ncbi:hypothetical protein CAC42_7363 [Sphaceloma murrayae]|uniref:Small ribosomal subunit protein mS23 n=1 Tax=Sphaceloma murrayae TaxID=2082308 RepID=A0A2K1QWY0_9PEZI|nr:hypothetical protein CAC42_7363 [Sphaceloma murrayae]
MGRYDFGPQRVHRSVTRLLATGRQSTIPAWYAAVESFPPSERLVRPALQSRKKGKGRSSRMFKPVNIAYPEDELRSEFFGDHPWELARPRTILEDDGKDYQRQDWGRLEAPGRALNGESVVQRQVWLMKNEGLTKLEAYDKARKEFYTIREQQDIDRRIATEEARYVGAQFGKGAVQIGLELEDREFENWKRWARNEVTTIREINGAGYSGTGAEEATIEPEDIETQPEEVQGQGDAVDAGNPLQQALGPT